MGDFGTGKSTLIRQLLSQLEARGDTAIVYDPALEYTPQFYSPERSDVILNPLDARSPYWSPGDELRHDAEALTLATSLFPERANENPFFTEGPRRIFAHLLTFRPTAEELASWLCHDDELDRRVHGTPYASIIDRQAPAQRSGVLAALNMVADTPNLLPPESATGGRWSAMSWARDRRGWLFLTSTPETRTRLVPLTSLWLDMLVLRLMNHGQPGHRPVWFVLDETPGGHRYSNRANGAIWTTGTRSRATAARGRPQGASRCTSTRTVRARSWSTNGWRTSRCHAGSAMPGSTPTTKPSSHVLSAAMSLIGRVGTNNRARVAAERATRDCSERIDRSHDARRFCMRPRCSAVSRVPFVGSAALGTASAPCVTSALTDGQSVQAPASLQWFALPRRSYGTSNAVAARYE